MLQFLWHMLERPLRSSRDFVYSLKLIWILALLHGEFLIFWRAARQCAPWPRPTSSSITSANDQALERFLVVGDPQLTDAFSYQGRPGILLRISEFYSDLYMKRNYRHLSKALVPDATLFMGDLMDGGREWDNVGYKHQAARFHRVFPSRHPQFFMAGNHDIGFGNGIKSHVYDRFKAEFGPSSHVIRTSSSYSIVVVDTVSLSANNLTSKDEALRLLDTQLPPHPRILMSHVPLYRPPGTSCGPDRQGQSDEIYQGTGYQYQNLLAEDLSQLLLERVNPVAVFSGDDHDYCAVWHNNALEITVPTFSMAQGLKYPGVLLLDLSPSEGDNSFATKLCWLPDQIAVFASYGYLAVATLAALCIMHGFRQRYHHHQRNTKGNRFASMVEDLPMPATTSTRSSSPVISTRRFFLSALTKDISDIAFTGIITYILCVVFL